MATRSLAIAAQKPRHRPYFGELLQNTGQFLDVLHVEHVQVNPNHDTIVLDPEFGSLCICILSHRCSSVGDGCGVPTIRAIPVGVSGGVVLLAALVVVAAAITWRACAGTRWR